MKVEEAGEGKGQEIREIKMQMKKKKEERTYEEEVMM